MLLLSNVVDYGMSLQEAIDFPRIFARGLDLEMEHTFPTTVMDGLARLKRDEVRLNRFRIERSRWRGIEFVAGVGVPTTFRPSTGGVSNE
jgi:gamma-glutamyltranspeptidase